MAYLSYVDFFCCMVYTYLAGFIYLRNRTDLINRLCAATLACFSVWSFGMVFVHNPHVPRQTAFVFENLASLGWCCFASAFLLFITAFTEKKRLLQSRVFYAVLLIPPAFFIYQQFTGGLINDFIRTDLWRKGVWSGSVWTYLFFTYYFVFMLTGVAVLFRAYQTARNAVRKKQIKVVLLSIIFALPLATLTDVVFTVSGIRNMPNLGVVFSLIWASGVVYAMVRYRFLAFTPVLAADEIINNMAELVVLLDSKGRISFTNAKTSEVLGYRQNDLNGMTLDSLFPLKARDRQVERIMKERNIRGADFLLESKSGERIPVIFSNAVVEGTAGEVLGTVCLAVDISDRIETERALLREKVFTEHITNSIPGLFYVYDERGKNVMFNDNVYRITGIAAEELFQRGPFDIFPPEERKKVEEVFREVFEKGEVSLETELVSKDGKEVPYYVIGKKAKIGDALYVIIVGIDNTERKRAQREIEKAAEEWKNTFDAITDMVFIEDRDYTITRVNKAMAGVLGRRPEEIVGRKCYEVMHKRGEPWKECPFAKTREDGKPHTQKVFDPALGMTMLVSTAPIFNDKGEMVAAVHISKDISDMEKTEKELKRKIKDLETFHKIVVGRELKILELKKKMTELANKLKEKPPG